MDLEPTEVDKEVAQSFHRLLVAECSLDVVRGAEPTGHDPELWKKASGIGIPGMVLGPPEDRASTVQVALACELFGSTLAPLPAVESIAAAIAINGVDGGIDGARDAFGSDVVDAISSGELIVGIALLPIDVSPVQLVLYGATCDAVVGIDGERLVLIDRGAADVGVLGPTHGSTGLARWNVGSYQRAVVVPDRNLVGTTWRVLSAARLVGVAERALAIGAEYASQREAFGRLIGSFQGVAHPLADSAAAISGARLLARKAAWLLDRGRSAEADRTARMAHAFAAETALITTTRSVHVHGGYGAALDYDIQLFHQRARAWGTAAGDPRGELAAVGRSIRNDMTSRRDDGGL